MSILSRLIAASLGVWLISALPALPDGIVNTGGASTAIIPGTTVVTGGAANCVAYADATLKVQCGANLTFTTGFTSGPQVIIGSGANSNTGAAIEIDKALSLSVNAHGFVDSTMFTTTGAGNAYDSFDCLTTIQGAFQWSHYHCVQDSSTTKTTVTTLNSFISAPNCVAGCAITARNGIFVNDAQVSGGGAITTNTGVLVASLSGGGTNVAIQTLGSGNPVIFAGQVQYTNWNPPASGTGPVLTIPSSNTYYLKVLGDYAFTWGQAASALLTLGSRNSNGSIWMNVPSFNGSNDSGFGVSGSYNSGTNITTVNVGSYGVNSGGPFGSILNLVTTTTTAAVNTAVLTPTNLNVTPVGSAASPSLSVGNATTGFYSVSTTGLGASVNGVVKYDWGITNATAFGSSGFVATAAAPTVAAAQVGFGSTTAALSNCGSAILTTATACLVVNIAGTTRYIPYF